MNNRILSLIAATVLSLSTLAATFETDRDWYLAGEAMTVSVTADDTRIAYAELCDTRGLAAGIVISLQATPTADGRGGYVGKGILELPPDLHSGYYLLSVYTRHDPNVTQRLVAIVNPLRRSVDDDISWEAAPSDSSSLLPPRKNLPLSTSNLQPSPFPELEGHIIMARIHNVSDGTTFKASDICPSLSIIGKQIHYFEGRMVNDTTAIFNTYGVHGRQPLVLSATASTSDEADDGHHRPRVSLPVEIISPFAALVPEQLPHLVFHYNRSEVEARSLDMQRHQLESHSTFNLPPSTFNLPPSSKELFGQQPYLSYNLDEYRQFFTVREVLIEYVNCVKATKINGVQQLMVRKGQEFFNSAWPTLVLIDGMPVTDVERLLNYDARRIHYINIYTDKYTFGNGIYNGVLSFVTRSGQLTNYPVERHMQYLEYDFPQ